MKNDTRPKSDTSKLAIHTVTTKGWSPEESIKRFSEKGVGGITFWRQDLEGRNPENLGKQARDAGLEIVSLCCGGFFPAPSVADRQTAIEDNLTAIEQAASLGAPLVVLVCGALPGQSLEESRKQITEGIAALLPFASECDVKLGIEPLHPMYADDRSAVNTMKQANDICQALQGHPSLGVVADVYHTWWDPDLKEEIDRAGRMNRLFAFHLCDWKTPTMDLLNDRGVMGEGCIQLSEIRGWVKNAGFQGWDEVEISSNHHWNRNQGEFLEDIIDGYLKC